MTSLNRSFSHRVVTTFPKRVSAKSPLALRLLVAPMDTSSYMRKLTNDGSGLSGSGTRVLHLIDMCYSRVLTTPVAGAKEREVGTTVGEERGESMHMQMRQSVS